MERGMASACGLSRYQLTVGELLDTLSVVNLSAHMGLSEPYVYHLNFTCSNPDIDVASVLNQDATLTFHAPPLQTYGVLPDPAPLRQVHGVVRMFSRLSRSVDETRYTLELVPRLALLAHGRQHAIYQHLSVVAIVEKVLRERHDFIGSDFEFRLSRDYPVREYVCQWGESDLVFISRLLSEVGIGYYFEMDARLNRDVVVFFDDQRFYVRGINLPLRVHSGLNDEAEDAVWALEAEHHTVTKTVVHQDYNYRAALSAMTVTETVLADDSTTSGEAYCYGANYRATGHEDETESGRFFAHLHHERELNGQHLIRGKSTQISLVPGQLLDISGEIPEVMQAGVVITTTTVSKVGRDSPYEVSFTAIPYRETVCYRPALLARPVIAGTVPARVSSVNKHDTYAWLDGMGRYRVKMDFDRESWKTGYESLWVRLAKPYAGDTYGLHLPLLDGTEVAIAFEEGNSDRPYIAYALHDSRYPDPVTQENHKRNVIRTPANNKLRLDDERGKEHIKLSTEYGGKSQLNLGHLVDSKRQKRGEGFELRSDDWGAIRAGKGLFISTDKRAGAVSDQLDMQEAVSQLTQALQLAQALHSAAETAQAELADIAQQKALLQESVAELKQQALVLSAPAGIAQVSPKSIQLSAGENLTTTSGGNTDMSVLKKFTLAAGERLSLYAQRLGIKLFAAAGRVDIQAQNDEMGLEALQDITVKSSAGKIEISAKKEIVLMSGGGYIRIADGVVESGAPDKIIQRAAVWQKFGGQSASQMAQQWATADFSVTPKAIHVYDASSIANQSMVLQAEDAGEQALSTSDDGKAAKQKQLGVEISKLQFRDKD